MVKLYDGGVYLVNGTELVPEAEAAAAAERFAAKYGARMTGKFNKEDARKGTIAWSILSEHNRSGNMDHLQIGFDAMASHDITFVGIIMLYNEVGKRKMKPSKALLLTIGILAGVSSGLFGVGVLLVVYISLTTHDMSAFKGNICAIFFAENAVRLVMYLFLKLFTASVLKNAAVTLPFVWLGLFLGQKAASFLDERRAKIVVMSMLIISGLAIVLSNI